jgi:hypothetical protein
VKKKTATFEERNNVNIINLSIQILLFFPLKTSDGDVVSLLLDSIQRKEINFKVIFVTLSWFKKNSLPLFGLFFGVEKAVFRPSSGFLCK